MSEIKELIQNTLSDNLINKLTDITGSNETGTRDASQHIIATLMAAVAQNTRSKEEARSLDQALAKDHDGGLLEDASAYLFGTKGDERAMDAEGILTHILGDKRTKVQAQIGKQTGLNEDTINTLMKKMAPVVMAILSRVRTKNNGFELDQLPQMLMKEAQDLSPSPTALKTLSAFLDTSEKGDVADKASNLMGNLFKKR